MSLEPSFPPFDPVHVYVKTEQGRDELARRAMGLNGRQRSVLIMVDGRKPCAELAGTMAPGVVAGILGELLALGLVAAPRTGPAPGMGLAPQAAARLASIKRRMRDIAETYLGLMAAEVVRRIERAADEAALLGVLGHWHMALQDSRHGRAVAPGLVEEMRIALTGGA